MPMNTTTVETDATPVAAVPKMPRSFSISLVAVDGGSMLRMTAILKKDGSAITFVVHTTKATNGKLQNTRGATEKHATLDAARTAIDKLVLDAVKLGWSMRKGRGGFKAKPDAFDAKHLPAPKTSKK
jgi:hypothetical protein